MSTQDEDDQQAAELLSEGEDKINHHPLEDVSLQDDDGGQSSIILSDDTNDCMWSNVEEEKGVRFSGRQLADVDQANVVSFITFSWLSGLMMRAYRKKIQPKDIPPCSPHHCTNNNTNRLEELWKEEIRLKGLENASFRKVCWQFVKNRVLIAVGMIIVALTFGFISPTVFMLNLIHYASKEESSIGEGMIWIFGLVTCDAARMFLIAGIWAMNYRTALQLQSACLGLLYKKILCMNHLSEGTVGQLISIFSNDGLRLNMMIGMSTLAISGPLVAIAGCIYILCILSPWAACGLAVFVIYYPIQYGISIVMGKIRLSVASVTDKRIKIIHEILTHIRMIKMYTWENCFQKKVFDIRQLEKHHLENSGFLQNISTSMAPAIPVIATIISFLAHVLAGNDLTAAQAFPVFAVLVIQIRPKLLLMMNGLLALFEGRTAMYRIQCFLKLPEVRQEMEEPIDRSQVICISNGYFGWEIISVNKDSKASEKERKKLIRESKMKKKKKKSVTIEELCNINDEPNIQEVLSGINISIPKGGLIAIVGPVGCGKSSLLKSILGHLHMTSGHMAVVGLPAYVSQQPWVMNASVKENILFGQPFDSKRYYSVIYACALNADMIVLPAGDQTEVGEQGVNLSGGQRQRIALARAVYSDRDIFLLDDPLSSVDAKVSSHILEKCILGLLKEKTVVLVTHQLNILSKCDKVCIIVDGQVVAYDSHEELFSNGSYTTYFPLNAHIAQQDNNNIEEEAIEIVTKCIAASEQEVNEGQDNLNSYQSLKNSIESNISMESNTENKSIDIKDTNQSASPKSGVLIQEEKPTKGGVGWITYLVYVDALGGWFTTIMVLLTFIISVGSLAFSSWWLAVWLHAKKEGSPMITINSASYNDTIFPNYNDTTTNYNDTSTTYDDTLITSSNDTMTMTYNNETMNTSHNDTDVTESIDVGFHNMNDTDQVLLKAFTNNQDMSFYQIVYASTIGVIFITSLLRSYIYVKVTLKASTYLHNTLLKQLISTNVRFFDVTPIGRIYSLFTHDIDEVDSRIPSSLLVALQNGWLVIFSILFIVLVYPWFLIALVILSGIFLLVRKIFSAAIRDLKRMEIRSRSPLLSHISTTVQGLDTIRAFQKEREFMHRYCYLSDKFGTLFYLQQASARWLGVRLEMLTLSVIGTTALLVVLLRGTVPAAFAGLALAYASQMSGLFQFVVRTCVELEAKFTSVERISNYIQDIEPEEQNLEVSTSAGMWPNNGDVTFQNVSLSYGPGLPKVLKGLDFEVDSGEKIGIVGRSGSGKTSLANALLRMNEITQGVIVVDRVNLSHLTLHEVRSAICMIPQESVLFHETVRWNLDPNNIYSDEEIWCSLEQVSLKSKIKLLYSGLQGVIQSGGENLSAGERQLLCLARAMLRRCKILVLDEATAYVDGETDKMMQQAIQEAFNHCTVFNIAHRLDTISGYDKIIVMDNGKILEYDTPQNLVCKKDSMLSQLINAAAGDNNLSRKKRNGASNQSTLSR